MYKRQLQGSPPAGKQADAAKVAVDARAQPCEQECPDPVGHAKPPDERTSLGTSARPEDSAFEAAGDETDNAHPDCRTAVGRQICDSGAAAVPWTSEPLVEAGGVPGQAAEGPTEAPVAIDEAPVAIDGAPVAIDGPPNDTAAAAAARSGGDGTVCDSEDACMDDDAAVESAPAPGHKQVEAREKQCMSDTVQDTRTQGMQNDGHVPESQQVRTRSRLFKPYEALGPCCFAAWLVAGNLLYLLSRKTCQAAWDACGGCCRR